MALIEYYQKTLANLTPPDTDNHPSLLTIVNHGITAVADSQSSLAGIRASIDEGSHHICDREIMDAINKALVDHGTDIFVATPRPMSTVYYSKTSLQRIVTQSDISEEADLWEPRPFAYWINRMNDPLIRDTGNTILPRGKKFLSGG